MAATIVVLAASCADRGAPASALSSASTASRAQPTATQERLAHACRLAGRRARMPVLCPRWLPAPGLIEEVRLLRPGGISDVRRVNLGDGTRAYLVQLLFGSRARHRTTEGHGAHPFHVIFGGRARAVSLRTKHGLWPAHLPIVDAFRLIGVSSLEPGGHRPVRPHVVRRVRVGGRQALLLRVEPFPDGGIHGGHAVLVWNRDGHAYAMSMHFEGREGDASSRGELRTLQRAARSMTPVS